MVALYREDVGLEGLELRRVRTFRFACQKQSTRLQDRVYICE